MTIKTYFRVVSLCLVVGLFSACADENLANDKKENKPVAEVKGVKFTTGAPKMQAKLRSVVDDEGKIIPQTSTRTFITHEIGKGADAFWDTNDYIWVKDKNNVWQKSIAIELHDGGSSAEFTLPGASDDYAEGCAVRYTITPSSLVDEADAAIIPFNQTQSAPNDFSHAGRVGDSGIGTAHDKGNGMFNFELQHLPHYLCFLPRCENASLANNIRLTKIRLENDNSDGTIEVVGATYLLDQDPFNSVGIDTRYNVIELQSTDGNGFPIAATTADAAADACYMAILPGEHDLILTYTIKDPTTHVEAKITKKVSGTFKAGEITDVTANLTPMIFDDKYYMFDAQDEFWGGKYKQFQLTTSYTTETNADHFPKSRTSDPTYWANEDLEQYKGIGPFQTATHSAAECPNINELKWFVTHGKDYFDENWVWATMNHLQKGGFWVKKLSVIAQEQHKDINDLKLAAPDGTDYRAQTTPFNEAYISYANGTPPNISDYFFIPLTGLYGYIDAPLAHIHEVRFNDLGADGTGYYWSSTPGCYLVAYGSPGRAGLQLFSGSPLSGAKVWNSLHGWK